LCKRKKRLWLYQYLHTEHQQGDKLDPPLGVAFQFQQQQQTSRVSAGKYTTRRKLLLSSRLCKVNYKWASLAVSFKWNVCPSSDRHVQMLVRERTTIHSLSDNRVSVTVRFSYAVQRKIPYQLIKSSSTVDEVGQRGARSLLNPKSPWSAYFGCPKRYCNILFLYFQFIVIRCGCLNYPSQLELP
jgi:hypothetical protein